MEITGLRLQVAEPDEFNFQWKEEVPAIQTTLTAITLETDEGVEGTSMAWLGTAPTEIADTIERLFEPLIIGADVWDRERIWQDMMDFTNYGISPKAASAIDIALWDLAGKALDLPVYKLLGAYREEIPAYASTVSYDEVDEYVDIALQCQEQGFQGLKLHAYAIPDKDIEVCRAVREAVGEDMELMLDPVNAYDYQDAVRVGQVLEDLDFYWYEAPIRDEDVPGYAEITQSLDIPVAVGESNMRGIWSYPKYLIQGAGDILRVVGDAMGGITGMRKVGALCETHNRKLEPHSYGPTLVQAAHLHYMLSVENCDFFEVPVPRDVFQVGMKDVIEVDDEGMVHAPSKPGLGYDIDWDALDEMTTYSYSSH